VQHLRLDHELSRNRHSATPLFQDLRCLWLGVVLKRMALCAVFQTMFTARAAALRCFPDMPSLTR
jgi:hypothetical protein